MSELVVQFIVRESVADEQATIGNPRITRYVEFNRAEDRGLVWYASGTGRARCLHEPLTLDSRQDFAGRIIAWLQEGDVILPNWPNHSTCMQVPSSCLYRDADSPLCPKSETDAD